MDKDEQQSSQNRSNETQSKSSRRFRLAEIFAEANPSSVERAHKNADALVEQEAQRRLDKKANALGVKLPPAVNQDVIATANRVYDTTPRATVIEVPLENAADARSGEPSTPLGFGSLLARSRARRDASRDPAVRERSVSNVKGRNVAPETVARTEAEGATVQSDAKFSPSKSLSGDFSPNTLSPNQTLTWNEEDTEATHDAFPTIPRDGRDVAGREQRNGGQHNGGQGPSGQTTDKRANSMSMQPNNDMALYTEIEQLRGGMEEMYRVMTEMQERGDAQDKVFNTLHAELQDYKNDFIYEHMKPVVRPLLFLFDHMEQFENELATQRKPAPDSTAERRLLSPELMCENISFFREQLVEALRICEVTPMKRPEGEVDSRLHKVVDTVPTDASGHNMIQKVVRSGWYLNGRVFRPAEVTIGLSRQ